MSVPVIQKMDVYPVAGYDSMLLNLSGAHGPFFTRNVVIMHASIGDYKRVLQEIKHQYGSLDQGGRGNQTFDLRTTIHAQTAVETAFLDLLGKYLHEPVAALLGDGQQREDVPVLGYLFFIGDRQQTDLPYIGADHEHGEWGKVRREPALTPDQIVREAQAAYDRYGFTTFKLKGGVLSGEKEVQVMKALHQAFPKAKLDIDPNGAWSLNEAVQYASEMKGLLNYIEDPCGAENGFSGREILAEFQRRTHIPTATNMVDTDWRQMASSLILNAVSIPLADPHFWTMQGSVEVAKVCHAFGLNWGIHSNNHFDISLAMAANAAAAAPGHINAIDTHWIWQDGQALTKHPYEIHDGQIHVDSRNEGLGIEVNMDAITAAHQLYLEHNLGARDDAKAMQYLIPHWQYDPKKPALVR